MGRAEQIERRRKRGRSESYEISNLGEHPIWSRFSVQGPSGKQYEVAIRSLKAEIYHCQCPDFATNSLGTCKHVESVLNHLTEHSGEALQEAQAGDQESGSLVYLDAGANPPQVRFRANGGATADTLAWAKKAFDADGLLHVDLAVSEDFAARAEDAQIELAPEALAHIEEVRVRNAWGADRSSALEDFARFRDAVVKHRDHGEEPPADDAALHTFVSHFGELADWELDGAEHLIRQGRAMLADDPELDKVRQTLAACELLRLTGRAKKILLTCPGARRQRWMSAVAQLCDVSPRIVGGATFEELARAEANSPYAVASYNRLYRHMDRLGDTEWDTLVLDEVQRIKSWPAPTGQAIKSFKTAYAFALTSARLEQRPQGFFYTAQLLDPYLFGPAWKFMDEHVLRDGRGAAIGSQNMDQALDALGDRWLRRTLKDVGRPAAPRSVDLNVEVTHFQHRQLDPLLRTLLAMARVQQVWSAKERQEVVSLLGKLRTICTLPELIKPERPGSPKLDEMCHLVEDICHGSEHTVTVLCRQEVVAEAIAKRLLTTGVTIHRLTAEPSAKERKKQLAALAKGERPFVLVTSDEAIAGADLSALAQIVIHAELPWSPAGLERRADVCAGSAKKGCALVYNLLCASTPEAAAAEAIRRPGDHMAQLVPDPDRELEALVDAEEWQLRELIGLVVDERMVLRPKKALLAGKPVSTPQRAFTLRGLKAKERSRRAQVPQKRYLLGEKREGAAPRRAAPLRPERGHASADRSPAQAVRPTTAGDVLVLGLETREDRLTASQPSQIHTLGLAMAVTYSFRSGSFTAWRSEYINDLVRTLLGAKLVVGYNPFGFEYKILAPYTGRNLSRIPTVDLMLEITKQVGRKLPFDLITGPTLNRPWAGDRTQASTFFKQGRTREIAGLCTEGVKVVRDIFLHSLNNGELLYKSGPADEGSSVKLDLRPRLDLELLKLIQVR
ncbi:MAG: DEAD/DEAH box helicase [bacterium]